MRPACPPPKSRCLNRPHPPSRPRPLRRAWQRGGLLLLAGLWTLGARAGTPPSGNAPGPELTPEVTGDLQRLVGQAAITAWGSLPSAPRLEVVPGQLDPRLKLAPCHRIEAYLPSGVRPLGNTRVGLRCREGRTLWNVYLPVTVRLHGRAVVTRGPLPAGTLLTAEHLTDAEVDLAASRDLPHTRPEPLIGRTLARGLGAGEPLRQADLTQRRWFAAGDLVRIVANGPGFAISSEGQALSPGFDGQLTKVRTEGGRIVTGTAAGPNRVELPP